MLALVQRHEPTIALPATASCSPAAMSNLTTPPMIESLSSMAFWTTMIFGPR
jgi:hypothetical protein